MHLQQFVESVWGPKQGYQRCFADIANLAKIYITLLTVTYKLTCIAGSFVGEGVSTQMNKEAGKKFSLPFSHSPPRFSFAHALQTKLPGVFFTSYVPSLQRHRNPISRVYKHNLQCPIPTRFKT